MQRLKLVFLILLSAVMACSNENELFVQSPNEHITLTITNNRSENQEIDTDFLSFSVTSPEGVIIPDVSLGLQFEQMPRMNALKIIGSASKSVDTSWERVWGKRKKVKDQYNELIVNLEEVAAPQRKLDIYLRVYNDGVAFRYGIPEQDSMDSIAIVQELTSIRFQDDHEVWTTKYDGAHSHQENEFVQKRLSAIEASHLPFLVNVSDSKKWIVITEANLTNWSGVYITQDSIDQQTVKFLLAERKDDPGIAVRTTTPAVSPWRTIMIADNPGAFLESDLVHNLNEPNKIEDVSWIEPGKSAWDWWWSNKYAPDVDFEVGSNTETMKYFIDFASEMGWQYQLVDWQWYGEPFAPTDDFDHNPNPDVDITQSTDQIDIPELVAYAKEKNVKLLLWLEWNHANRQMEEAFPLYEKWGIAGVKIDFMASEDQEMVDFYHRAIKLAARHHLLINFHGAYKPTGVSRTYPNLITREGVLGNEYNKWSDLVTPEHTVTLAFTRNILGEMDFTPGAFVHTTRENFKTEEEGSPPMAMGTRANQLAMLVVFESALQVMCDAPYNYRSSPAGLDFLKVVPTTWDDTRVLSGEIGDYIMVARQAGSEWYLGGMTDWSERELEVSLDFLPEGKYVATVWQDGRDANENPSSLETIEMEVDSKAVLKARLAKGGGYVVHLKPKV